MERSNIVNHPRRRKLVAASAVSTALLASLVLTGCSNPYSTQQVDPATVTATKADSTVNRNFGPDGRPDEKAPSADDPLPEDVVPTFVENGEDPIRDEENFYGIVPEEVEISSEVTEKFAESSSSIARDALYSLLRQGRFYELQTKVPTQEAEDMALLSIQDLYSEDGYTELKRTFSENTEDSFIKSWQMVPRLLDSGVFTYQGVDYKVDAERAWIVYYFNPSVRSVVESVNGDGAVFLVNRSITIPLEGDFDLQINAGLSLTMVPGANGWVISDWRYDQGPAEKVGTP